MSELILAERSDIVNIADAIRNSGLVSGEMFLHQIPGNIYGIINDTPKADICRVVFPEQHINETIYYTNESFEFVSFTRTTNEKVDINVVRNTVITSNMQVLNGDTYTWETNSVDKINPYSVVVKSSVTFGYDDGAPV